MHRISFLVEATLCKASPYGMPCRHGMSVGRDKVPAKQGIGSTRNNNLNVTLLCCQSAIFNSP